MLLIDDFDFIEDFIFQIDDDLIFGHLFIDHHNVMNTFDHRLFFAVKGFIGIDQVHA